jgi:uncharacterized iron-regulated protein
MAWLPPRPIVALLVLAAGGCGERPAPMTQVASPSVAARESRPALRLVPPKRPNSLTTNVVERAVRDFEGLRADGEALAPDELLSELGRASVLCIGEEPNAPEHHSMQLTVLRELNQRAPAKGIELGLGLAIFAARDQRWLDEYAAKDLGEGELLGLTHFEEVGGDFAFYRPVVEFATSRGIALVALNAPPELVNRVRRGGFEALSQRELESLPELDMDTNGPRRSFDQERSGHPATGAGGENGYAAEIVTEETVAEHAARWVNERRPARQLVVVTEMRQCERTAVPARLARRGVDSVVSLCLIVEARDGSPKPVPEGFDYGFVLGAS